MVSRPWVSVYRHGSEQSFTMPKRCWWLVVPAVSRVTILRKIHVEHGKPDPRLVGIALRKLGLPASEAVMIGDTPYDAEAGLEAGTSAGGVLTGGFTRAALTEAGCFLVAEDLLTLLPDLQTRWPLTTPSAAEQKSPILKSASR